MTGPGDLWIPVLDLVNFNFACEFRKEPVGISKSNFTDFFLDFRIIRTIIYGSIPLVKKNNFEIDWSILVKLG